MDSVYCYLRNVKNIGNFCRQVAQGESAILTRWMSRVQIPACLPFFNKKNVLIIKRKGISKTVMPFSNEIDLCD